ncbi:MAG: branched-chain amino acid ABC transporter permease [Alphaproteobacteria bacterium]|nr:MAG: branched-chain amino acid ABC transporter permease [Alphaproteobacteria bacterium]
MRLRNAALIAIVAVAVGWPFVVENRYITHIGVLMAISISTSVSLNMMLRIGQLSIAQAAFMGLGAYTSTLLVMRLGLPFLLAFPASGLLVAAFAAAIGPIFLRVKGVYFVLLTFALGEGIVLVFQEWVSLFGGNNGIHSIPKASLFGMTLVSPRSYYFLALALAAVTFLAAVGIFRSAFGAVLDSLNENESLSQSLGVNPLSYRVAVFAVAGFFTGLAGSVYAHYTGFLSPDAFTFWSLVDMLVINVIGGIGSPLGPVLGAILLVPLPELLRDVRQYQMLSYGLLLLTAVLFLPSGIVGLLRKLQRRWLP